MKWRDEMEISRLKSIGKHIGVAVILGFACGSFNAHAADDLTALPSSAIEAPNDTTYFLSGGPRRGALRMIDKMSYDPGTSSVTMPLYKGQTKTGETVWYIITETSEINVSKRAGVGYSTKLKFADKNNVVRDAWIQNDGSFIFDAGGVDFNPIRALEPGESPDYFPPKSFHIGALGDEDYTPFVRLANAGNVIVNAPTVAFNVTAKILDAMCDGDVDYNIVHDRVLKICPRDGTVSMRVSIGTHEKHRFLFFSTESNADIISVLEAATYAPRLAGLYHGDKDDGPFSSVEQNYVVVNGQMGKGNPERQGINSAIADGLSVIDIFGGAPTVTHDYSPIWNIYPVIWTEKAHEEGLVKRLYSAEEVRAEVRSGRVTGLGGGEFGPAGFNVNCPVVMRLN